MDATVDDLHGRAAPAQAPAAVSFSAFAREHGLVLTRFAFLITGDRGRGEDLVQDALLNMYRRFGAELRLDNPLAYARRAIVNGHVSWLRRHPAVEFLLDHLPDRPAPVPDGADDDAVWSALGVLSARERTVLVLRYEAGLTDREIAAVLSCRESSVRSLAARAFARLRPVLRPVPAPSPTEEGTRR